MKEKFENPMANIESKEKKLYETNLYPITNIQLQQRYDRIATKWNSEAYDNTRRDDLIPMLIENADIEDGQNILEVMCGTAILSKEIKKRYQKCKVYGLDFSRGMLNTIPEEINKIQASVIGMPFPENVFDKILLRTAIYDLPKRLQLNALREVGRTLSNTGTFIFQTYHTTLETHETLNEIANLKDKLAGQYQDMGKENPRYFATINELEEWFDEAGFEYERILEFESEIQLQKAQEMPEHAKKVWANYVLNLPQETKQAIKLKEELGQKLVYTFPGVIYKLKRK